MKELIIPIGILLMLASIIVPLPTVVIDLLLVGNLILAAMLLLGALYSVDPLKLTALPTLLLITTMFRLALNVSTTRLILGTGDAGATVQAFGALVIQNNLLVGAVIFLIVTLIQFLVIAKGGERVAEVSARFTLDALPGKQMSIDADVRAGLMTFETASLRRQELQTESRFYGALDGAMKFIKGDAIAAMAITAINIVGGLWVGAVTNGLPLSFVVSHYTKLTVGDGLLSQLPALLSSLAAGVVVTRVVSHEAKSFGLELMDQLGASQKIKWIMSGLALAFALVPGLPFWPFLLFALMFIISASLNRLDHKEREQGESAERFKPELPAMLEVEIPATTLSDTGQKTTLLSSLEALRATVFSEAGILLPPFQAKSSPTSSSICVRIRGVPITGMKAEPEERWTPDLSERLLSELRTRYPEFIDDTQTRELLRFYETAFPDVVQSAVPGCVATTTLSEVLRMAVQDHIPLHSFDIILQAVAEYKGDKTDPSAIYEHVRSALKRTISQVYAPKGNLRVLTLAPEFEQTIIEELKHGFSCSAESMFQIINVYTEQREQIEAVLTSRCLRRTLSEGLEMCGKRLPVLAYDELRDEVNIVVTATVNGSETHTSGEVPADELAA